MLKNVVSEEQNDNIQAQVYDINTASLDKDYGLISCTVTLMSIDPILVDNIITDMQKRTLPGGYNLIVYAMSSDIHLCPVPFPFTLKAGLLPDVYTGWDLIKYNEDFGTKT